MVLGNQAEPADVACQVRTTTATADFQRKLPINRDYGHKSIGIETPDCTVRLNGTNDSTENGGIEQAVKKNAHVSDMTNIDSETLTNGRCNPANQQHQ